MVYISKSSNILHFEIDLIIFIDWSEISSLFIGRSILFWVQKNEDSLSQDSNLEPHIELEDYVDGVCCDFDLDNELMILWKN